MGSSGLDPPSHTLLSVIRYLLSVIWLRGGVAVGLPPRGQGERLRKALWKGFAEGSVKVADQRSGLSFNESVVPP